MEENITKIKCEACDREFGSQEALASHNAAKHNIPLSNTNQGINKSNNKTFFWIAGILIVIILGYFLMNGSLTGNATSANADSSDVQKITLSFKNNYSPNTITVEAGKPVEITLDSSVRGCYRSFNIRELGVSYSSSGPSDTIKFTQTKKGSFEFDCGMRMGYGTIVVVLIYLKWKIKNWDTY